MLASEAAALGEHLENARSRLAASEFAPGFEALLAAWRMLRAAEIAELCELLSTRAARNKPIGTDEEKQTERVVAWMNAFHERTQLGLGVLIADLDAAFAKDVPPRFIFPRVEALATVKDDPRVSSAMVRVGSRLGAGGAWRKVLPQCVRGLQMAGDPRCVDQLAAAIADNPTAPGLVRGSPLATASKALRALRSNMQDGPPPLPEELAKVVSAIRLIIESIASDHIIPTPERAKAEGADPAALLAEVRAAPDDYELRLVLADALMSTGDPLGEFIVLQCRRANGESMEDAHRTRSRERALLKEHLRAWLGPLASVVTLGSAVFERGFLDQCEAVATKRVTAEVHFQHIEWATVRSIRFRGESRITPSMRALREAIGVDITALAQLAANGHRRLERLTLNESALWTPGQGEEGTEPNDTVRAFAACEKEKFPMLTHLELGVPFIKKPKTDWIWKAPWRTQLRSIGVPGNAVEAWVSELRRRDHLEEVCFHGEGHRAILRKESEGGGLSLNLRIEPPLSSSMERALHDTLSGLAKLERFCDVTIHTPPMVKLSDGQRQRLEQAISRLKRART